MIPFLYIIGVKDLNRFGSLEPLATHHSIRGLSFGERLFC